MVQISELTKDKSFRTRLILSCLCVSAFVSIIYVVVSYRLTAELGIRTELESLQKEAKLIDFELSKTDPNSPSNARSLATRIYSNEDVLPSVFIRAHNNQKEWLFLQKISTDKANDLQKLVSQFNEDNSGSIEINDQNFVWFRFQRETYSFEIIKTIQTLDLTMAMVGKRLLLVSLIVFWIAVWLALTLSSWIAKRVQQKNDALAKIATHDSLTGLPNRLFLDDLLNHIFDITDQTWGESEHQPITGFLFVIDLDKFKEVNDSFGHTAGDRLLIEIATRIANLLASDQVLVRVGGDEFIIWAPNVSLDMATELADQVVTVCDSPVMINKLAVNTGASIGIAHYPTHADSGETLLINADTAMYKAKKNHSGWVLYDESDSYDYISRIRLRSDLTHSMENEEIKVYYQPKVELSTDFIIGVEALARWYHPEDGVLLPGAFIDIIEQSGRVQEFGRYITLRCIIQLSQWQKLGINIPIAINLSPYNLLDPGLVAFISDSLREHNVDPSYLEIELTENQTSINIHNIRSQLESLKDLGVKLAIDDFGTGMSSLAYIANLSVDIIKIDRSFTFDMQTNTKHLAIIATALTLSKSFGCKMVAEGVENTEQAKLLLDMGCDYAQGYLFAKPMNSVAMTNLLSKAERLERSPQNH